MVYIKRFQILSREKVQNWHRREFKYSLPSLYKLSLDWNYVALDNNAWILPNFSFKHTVNVTKTIISTHIQLVLTKFNMVTDRLDNYHQSFWQLIDCNVSCLSWAPQSFTTHFSWSMSGILWRYTISCRAPTPSNPKDLDPDYLTAGFSVQWTLAHRSRYTVACLHSHVPQFNCKTIIPFQLF